MPQIRLKNPENNVIAPTPLQLTPSLKSVNIFNGEGKYLNSIRLFYAYFDKVPNLKSISNIDCTRIRKWMATEMPDNIINTHTYEQYGKDEKKIIVKHIIYIMKNELLLTLETDSAEVVYASGNGHLAQELLDKLKRFSIREKRTTDINMIISAYRNLTTIPVKIKKPRLNISTHYNDDLEPVHYQILNNLKKKNTKGLL